jgi:hypothetical protein
MSPRTAKYDACLHESKIGEVGIKLLTKFGALRLSVRSGCVLD